MGENEQLTAPQRRTIAALLEQRDVRAAARAAKVGETTLHRWLAEPAFRAALYVAEGALIDAAVRRLLQHQDVALTVILSIMADQRYPAGVRLRAATAVVDYMLKLRELRNVEERLSALEEKLAQRI
jgi:hypothetical protein